MESKAPLWKIFLCTLCFVGISFTWTLEIAYGTPFLLSLNLSRELTALVWLAGPLSGIIVQPLIGAISDNSTFRLGKRRPFMIMGGVIVLTSLLAIAFAQGLVSLSTGSDSKAYQYWTTVIVVISFYTLDFSLNAVQASSRSLVVDTFCVEQQDTANAFASNLGNLTNVFGYFMCYTNLAERLPSFIGGGASQMKALCVIGTIIFAVSVSVTCLFIHEKRPAQIPMAVIHHDDHFIIGQCRRSAQAISNTVKHIWRSGKELPTPIKRLYYVQFFSWMGWFPLLFYSTTWITGIYYQEHPEEKSMVNGNWENGTRAGSFALLIYASVSVVSGTILPWVTNRGYVSLKTLFTCSHLIFAVVTFSSYWIRTVEWATVALGIVGISWSCTIWIPFVLTAEYLYKNNDDNYNRHKDGDEKNWGHADNNQEDANSTQSIHTIDSALKLSTPTTTIVMTTDQQISGDNENSNKSNKQDIGNIGISLGIMNIFVALPQCVVALIAYAFFAIRQTYLKQTSSVSASASASLGQGMDDSAINDVTGVAWLMMFGSWMALVAAGLTCRLLDV